MKKEFSRKIKATNRYSTALYRGIMKPMPATLEEVWGDMKEQLDETCLCIDRACIEGVIHQQTAVDRKEMVLDRLLLALQKANIPLPVIPDLVDNRYTASWRRLGYTMPKCTWLREPRPWQLPGWKSAMDLRKEFKVYLIKRRAELKEKAKQEEAALKVKREEEAAARKR